MRREREERKRREKARRERALVYCAQFELLEVCKDNLNMRCQSLLVVSISLPDFDS